MPNNKSIPSPTPLAGCGKVSLPDGSIYEGDFKNSVFHGKGRLVWANTRQYEGEFKDGWMHGWGVYTEIGRGYEGNYRDGKWHGKGKFIIENVGSYEGDFVEGEFSEGEFVNDPKVDPRKITHKGEFRNWCLHGQGTHLDADGQKYAGTFVSGVLSGKGVCTRKDGYRGEGIFKNWCLHGRGVETYPNGDRYEGDFLEGLRDGCGIHTYADETRYEGGWQEGKKHGVGMLFDTKGGQDRLIKKGVWLKGKYLGQNPWDANLTENNNPKATEEYLPLHALGIYVGSELVKTMFPEEGVGGIRQPVEMIRRTIAEELGLIVPPIRVRDNLALESDRYVITINDLPVGGGSLKPELLLAMDSTGETTKLLEGIDTTDPASGLRAVWITESEKEEAEDAGYAVVDSETALAAHLQEVIRSNAAKLLSRKDTRRLLEVLREQDPDLVQDVIPDLFSVVDVHNILQNLLRERVSIRNLPAILETMSDDGRIIKDIDKLTECCRRNLADWLCNEYAKNHILYAVTLDSSLEDALEQCIQQTDRSSYLALPAGQARRLVDEIQKEVERQTQAGYKVILLTNPQVRPHLKRITGIVSDLATLTVMSYLEVLPEYSVEIIRRISLDLSGIDPHVVPPELEDIISK